MKYQGSIITGLSFVVGLAEALIYYNLGEASGGTFSYKIPPRKELLKTAGVVLVTSLVTAGLFQGVEVLLKPKAVAAKADPYYVLLKEKGLEQEARDWLAEHPLPKSWKSSPWSYAYVHLLNA